MDCVDEGHSKAKEKGLCQRLSAGPLSLHHSGPRCEPVPAHHLWPWGDILHLPRQQPIFGSCRVDAPVVVGSTLLASDRSPKPLQTRVCQHLPWWLPPLKKLCSECVAELHRACFILCIGRDQ